MLSEIIHIMEYTLYIYLSVSVGYIVLFLSLIHIYEDIIVWLVCDGLCCNAQGFCLGTFLFMQFYQADAFFAQ